MIEDLGVTALSSRRGLRPRLFEAHRCRAHRREVVSASAGGRASCARLESTPLSGRLFIEPAHGATRGVRNSESERLARFVARGTETHLAGRSDWQWQRASYCRKAPRDLEPAPPDLFDRTGFPAEASHFGYCSPLLRGPLERAKLLEEQKAGNGRLLQQR